MGNWKEEADKLYKQYGSDWSRMAYDLEQQFPNSNHKMIKERIRSYFRRKICTNKVEKIEPIQIKNPQSCYFEYKSDGSVVSEKFIELRDGQDKTPKCILEAHGLDPALWEIVSYKNNFWNSQLKGGTLQISYQSKITAKPTQQYITLDHIDEYFRNKKFQAPPVKPMQYDKGGEVLEIDLPDIHSGLLAWRDETGEDYDIHIAKDRFNQCAHDILERCKHKKLKKIIVATLGDLLHFDNENQTTTKGTFQQADGRLPKIFDTTLDMMIDFLYVLGQIAPVEAIYIPGNHDRVVGYMLFKALEMAYRSNSNYTFDSKPNPMKHRLVGCNLIGLTHGDMPKQNISDSLIFHAKQEYGQCKYAEVHAGHFHSLTTKETKRVFEQEGESGGVIVRYLPTICNASYWEHHEGYTSAIKTMVCYIWNESIGLRETWYNNIA